MKDGINKHYFLCEELLIPNVNKNDGGRINMVTNHFNQLLTLENSERPRVFTNFENQVGKYSSAIKSYNEPIQILKIFALNENNFFIIVELLESGKFDLIQYTSVINLTENYGYISDFLIDIKENEIIPANEIIYKNRMYDDIGNLQIGTNLKCIYLPKGGLTYEDGIYITEECAKKLAHTEVNEIEVMLNSNDVLINYYGNQNEYKPYPSIGEEIKNGILCARRRINYNFVLDEFKSSNFSEINTNDQCFFVEGIIEDIKVYTNLSDDEKNYKYNHHIRDLNNSTLELYTEINTYLSKLKNKNNELFSDDLNWLLQYSIDYIDSSRKFSYDNTEFNGTIIKFKIRNTVPANVGSKITGRFGEMLPS